MKTCSLGRRRISAELQFNLSGSVMSDLVLYQLPKQAADELVWSYRQLEHPSFVARLSGALAYPLGEAGKLIPHNWKKTLNRNVEASMQQALSLAIDSMDQREQLPAQEWLHKLAIAGTGAVGGFFGPLTTLAELLVATALMMRSIAAVARAEGEDVHGSQEARLACIQVFALGGRTREDQDADLGYYSLRITLGLHFESVLEFAGKAEGPHIPALIALSRAIAARFGVVISDKLAAQLVPVAGALGGAALNLVFMQHYQDVARGHFIVRRLEREFGVDLIRSAYQSLRQQELNSERESSLNTICPNTIW
ncbi:MAG TPA: peptidase [Chromatiaceae bacterium]|nr:peptidase [Chromatiaceae bacterium]